MIEGGSLLIGETHRLIVFHHVARSGSLSSAARALAVSQPAISRHIGILEDRLQVQLLVRGPTGIRLTQAGLTLNHALTGALESLDDAVDEIRGQTGAHLTLAVQPTIAESWLAPRFGELQQALAPTALSIVIFDRDEDLARLDHDLSVRFAPQLARGERFEELVIERVYPVASPGFASRAGLNADSPSTALLDGVSLLQADARGRSWMSWGDWFSHLDTAWSSDENELVYPTYSILVQQALAGRGVVLGWSTLLGDLVDRGLLVKVGPEVIRSDRSYCLVWPAGLSRHNGVRALRSWLRSMLDGQPEAGSR